MRKQESDPTPKDYSPPRGVASLYQKESQKSPLKDDYVSRLADDVLGEGLYPPLGNNRRYSNADTRRPAYESSYSTLPNRKVSAPVGEDLTFERNLSPPSSNYNTRNHQQPRQHDDEDLDAMISNLKQKTSGRDMIKVVSEIEGRRVTPPRISRERDNEDQYNDYGNSRQRRESGHAGRNDYSSQNDRGNNYSSYNNNDFSFEDRSANTRGRQQPEQQPVKYTVGNRRDMSTDRTRLRSTSISRRGSFQADSSDLNAPTSSRNRYDKGDSNAAGPFGGVSGPISSRKQPYLRSYSSNYSSND